MPSSLRVVLPSAQPAYAAALRWRDDALVDDRSLFDGRPIDGGAAAAELRTYFTDQPDAGSGDFVSKLRSQLSSASTNTVQVAAELLYVHTLISSTQAITSSTKRKLVDGVIGFRESGTSPIPDSLVPALAGGMAHPGQAYNSYRWKMFNYLIDMFGRVKSLPMASRREIITTYEAFEAFVSQIDDQSVWSQRYAIEHLLFPDVAPAILSRDDRGRIAASFGKGADAAQVGSVLARLEPNVHYGRQSAVNAYRTPYREQWEGLMPAMEIYIGWARRLATAVDLNREERQYKLERVPLIVEAFEAASIGSDVLAPLRQALRGFNVVDYRVTDDFLSWAGSAPTAAAEALRELRRDPGPESIDRALALIPRESFPGDGARLSVVSTLLMALDPAAYPPWRDAASRTTTRLTSGPRPQEAATEGELYALFLERLDLLLNVTRPETFLEDRLDAQGIAWLIATTSSPVEGWTEEENAQFQTWRTGKPILLAPNSPPEPGDQQIQSTPPPSPRSLEDLAESLYMGRDNTQWLEETITLLKHRRQVIIQGPPGTGKTYIGRAIAEFLADNPEQVVIVQFHPGTSYEDFVQGLRPDPIDPSMRFRVVNGPLITFARQAQESPENTFVLLIDEINRGNVPAIFGELYYLLEYRDRSVTLTYGETQALPKNLFIIGTMNTADRSITSLDSALRRRFYIRELRPGQQPVDGMLRRFLEEHDSSLLWLTDLLDRANQLIDDPEQSVGPSHFMSDRPSEDWARRAWDNSVMPTLRELFYRHPQRTVELEFASLKEAVTGTDHDSDPG